MTATPVMAAPGRQIFFVDARPGRSDQSTELERIRARKHAATVSHWTRKLKKSDAPRRQSDTPPSTTTTALALQTHIIPTQRSTNIPRRSRSSAQHKITTSIADAAILLTPAKPISNACQDDDSPMSSMSGDTRGAHAASTPLDMNDVLMGDIDAALLTKVTAERHYSKASPPDPLDCYSGLRTDPFVSGPNLDSPLVALARDHFVLREAPSNAAVYKIFDVTSIYDQYMLELFQYEDYVACSIASTQSMIERLRDPEANLSPVNLLNWNIAIQRLRQRLLSPNTPVDGVTVLTVLLFAASARTTRDFGAHETHKQSLLPLVTACGGLEKLGFDGRAKCHVLQWDAFWALNSSIGKTLFSESDTVYEPVYPDLSLESKVAAQVHNLPSGFQRLIEQDRLTADLIEVLSRTVDASDLLEKQGYVVDSNETFKSGPRRYADFLGACPYLGAASSPDDEPPLEKLITLSLILYCCNAFSPARVITVMYGGSRQKVTKDLLRWCTGEEDETEHPVKIWIWMTTVDSWRKADNTLLPQGRELFKALKKRYLGEMTAKETWDIMETFFVDQKFLSRCQELWDSI